MNQEKILDQIHKEQQYTYRPDLLVRIKSMMIDSMIVVALMYSISLFFESIGGVSNVSRGLALISVFLYEPILVSNGRTLGQWAMGLKVKRTDQRGRLPIGRSLLRYVVKLSLGVISLFSVHNDPQGRAIHDKLSQSVMVYRY